MVNGLVWEKRLGRYVITRNDGKKSKAGGRNLANTGRICGKDASHEKTEGTRGD